MPGLRYSDPHVVTAGTNATTRLKTDVKHNCYNTSKQELIRVKKYIKQERNKEVILFIGAGENCLVDVRLAYTLTDPVVGL